MDVNDALLTLRRANGKTQKPLLSRCNFVATGGSVSLTSSSSRKSSKDDNMCMRSKYLQNIMNQGISYYMKRKGKRKCLLQIFNIRFPTSYHSDSKALSDSATKPLRVADQNLIV